MKSMEEALCRNTNRKPYLLDRREKRVVNNYECQVFFLTLYCCICHLSCKVFTIGDDDRKLCDINVVYLQVSLVEWRKLNDWYNETHCLCCYIIILAYFSTIYSGNQRIVADTLFRVFSFLYHFTAI